MIKNISFFTLVEVMMAVLVLGTAVVTLMKIVNSSLHQLDTAQHEMITERVVYEVLAADATVDASEKECGGDLEEYPGYSWLRTQRESDADDSLEFERTAIGIVHENDPPDAGMLVLERID